MTPQPPMILPGQLPLWVEVTRTVAGSVDALIFMYALGRAFAFHGADRYMRLTLATLAGVLTYSQFALIAAPVPLTSRTYVSWVGSGVALLLFLLAVRAEKRDSDNVRHLGDQ